MTKTHTPAAKAWREKVADRELLLPERRLAITKEVALWPGNPRLLPYVVGEGVKSDIELEAYLQQTNGYDVLRKSIADVGQMEPIYVWKPRGARKFLVLEGATRVTILRELAKRHTGTPLEAEYRYVTAKVLPEDFSEKERIILLARIHVRGTGVRSWGRFIEAKFIHESVTEKDGKPPVMTVTALAQFMGKSVSWVQRLRDAFTFAQSFVDHVDDKDGEILAARHFSTLEEIAKSSGFGPIVRDYRNKDSAPLRSDVFEMVRHDVFKEYRDARFMKTFYDDPEKWAQLRTHEKHIGNKLALEEKAGSSNLAARIAALPGQIERSITRAPESLGEESLAYLHGATRSLSSHLSGAAEFRLHLREFTRALHDVSLKEVKLVTSDEYDKFREGIEDFQSRLEKFKVWS